MTITFLGHSFVSSRIKIKKAVNEQMLNNISKHESVLCYLGGYGDFDEICAAACREIKKEYPKLQLIYVTPYFNLSTQKRIKEMINSGPYDDSIFPPIEKTPLKFEISKRNEWMIKNSDLIIAYVNHTYGGAYKSLSTAIRMKKKILNINEYSENK